MPSADSMNHKLRIFKFFRTYIPIVLLGFSYVLSLSLQLPAGIYDDRSGSVWFQADIPRTLSNMTYAGTAADRGEPLLSHHRARVHPIFAAVVLPFTKLIGWATKGGAVLVTSIFSAMIGGAWLALFYNIAFKIIENRILAVLACLFAASSAGFLFWFPIAETYPPSSLSILLAVYFAVHAAEGRTFSTVKWTLMAAATLSMTITNFVLGILTLLVNLPAKKAAQLAMAALLIIVTAAIAQRLFIPTATLFFLPNLEQESHYFNYEGSGTPIMKALHVAISSVVVPPIVAHERENQLPMLSVQLSIFSTRSWIGWAAIAAWVALLMIGIRGLIFGNNRKIALFLAGAIGFQIFLHSIYGEETFLYSANSLPLLMAIALYGLRALPPKYAAAILVVATALCGLNNLGEFHRAILFL